MSTIHLLAIESSCDDTSAAILSDGIIRSNIVSSQWQHAQYGGVVPEVASRAHLVWIVPVIEQAIQEAGISLNDLNGIAFTKGPGLLGSLLVGVNFAKALSLALDIPLIEVNHMEAHIIANFIDEPKPNFPFLCLTVSGGHTQISKVHDYFNIEVIGYTLDDAAGEAFDKIGKVLGLPYPAGPKIDELSKFGKPIFHFPEPQVQELNFSFSGLKTSVLYFLQKQMKINPNFISEHINDLCSSIQSTIVTILLNKIKKAADITGINDIGIAGGVAANSELRSVLTNLASKQGWNLFIPEFKYCTDNAAMIAYQGYQKYKNQMFVDQSVEPVSKSVF